MKNKKMLYLVATVTITIWGLIIYKVYNGFFGNEEIATAPSFIPFDKSDSNKQNDTFSIDPTYRDPFLGTSSANPISFSKTPISGLNDKKIKPVASGWPSIFYYGLVKNQKSNKQLVIIQVNGQSSTISLGDKVGEIELTKVFRDSIEVKFGKEKRFFKK